MSANWRAAPDWRSTEEGALTVDTSLIADEDGVHLCGDLATF